MAPTYVYPKRRASSKSRSRKRSTSRKSTRRTKRKSRRSRKSRSRSRSSGYKKGVTDTYGANNKKYKAVRARSTEQSTAYFCNKKGKKLAKGQKGEHICIGLNE